MTVSRSLVVFALLLGLQVAGTVYAQSMPDDVKRALGRCVGKWQIENREGDKVSNAEASFTWHPNERCLSWQYKADGPAGVESYYGMGIFGWDGSRKVLVEHGVGSVGDVFTADHIISSHKWESPTEGTILIDGKFLVEKSLRIVEWKSDDEWTVTGTKRVVDGKAAPDLIGIFRRAK